MKKILFNPIGLCLIGAALGILSKLFDIYTNSIGNIFSELPVWILFGVIIAIFSESAVKAAFNIFPFCVGMLTLYYITAELTNSVYSFRFIIGWAAFSLLSPFFAMLTWFTKENGILPKLLSLGILATTAAASLLVYGGLRYYDSIILLILGYLLFFKKIQRPKDSVCGLLDS